MKTRVIAGTAIFTALTIMFTFIPFSIGGVGINLSLVPIALAGIMYGPIAGLFTGLVNGACVLGTDVAIFSNITVIGTVIVCLTKTGLAGLASGFLYKWISKKNSYIGAVVSSLSVPIINTGLFILIGLLGFFRVMLNQLILPSLINFSIELTVTIILSSSIASVVKYYDKKNHAI